MEQKKPIIPNEQQPELIQQQQPQQPNQIPIAVSGSQFVQQLYRQNPQNKQVFDRKNFVRSSSSLSLQMFIYFDQIYTVIYFLCEIILFLFKGNYLPYPPGELGPEIVGIFFYFFVQMTRLRVTSTGNKTEMSMYIIYSILLSVPVFFAYVYYLQYQTYCLAFDLSLTVIGIFFISCEVIASVFAAFAFREKISQQ